MNKKEYFDTIDMITPSDNVKSEIHERVFHQKTTKHPSYWKTIAASFVVICVAAISLPAMASEIQTLILKIVPSYAPLADKIETTVFTQSDEHVQMSVEELLSDGVVVKMMVKYTALDDQGKQWLKDFELNQDIFFLDPYMPNTIEYGINYSRGTEELTDYANENERVFMLTIESSSRDYYKTKGDFSFPLTKSQERVLLDIFSNVEIQSFKLHAPKEASTYYTPTYIEISPMSFVIYAKEHGVIDNGMWVLPDKEIISLEDESYFIMKDGSKKKLDSGWHNTTCPKPENMTSDLVLYSSTFEKLMHVDVFEAVVINGVRFEFEK